MCDNKEQIARIRKMERHLDRATAAVKRLTTALDKYETAQEDIAALNEYYGSEAWYADRESELPRGMASGLCR